LALQLLTKVERVLSQFVVLCLWSYMIRYRLNLKKCKRFVVFCFLFYMANGSKGKDLNKSLLEAKSNLVILFST
jgi:hypothetical protein